MSRRIICPNCGAEQELANPGVVVLDCGFCQTRIYLGDEQARSLGERSLLPEQDSRLALGASGTLAGRAFRTLGQVRYRTAQRIWTQWYLSFDDGSTGWLIEDARRLSLERAVPDVAVASPTKLAINLPAVQHQGVAYLTRHIGRASCEGSAGQLPFAPAVGQELTWADLESLDGEHCGSVQQGPQGQPWLLAGQPITHAQLVVEQRPDAAAAAQRQEALEVACPHCGAPIERPADREVETLVCGYCGSQADLSGGRARVMGINPDGLDPEFELDIGQAGTLRGQRWEVCGRLLLAHGLGRDAALSREYLLFNPRRGYQWLSADGDYWLLTEETGRAPVLDPLLGAEPGRPIPVGRDRIYRLARSACLRVLWVDGALPRRVAVGDDYGWAELCDPPRVFHVEADGLGLHCFEGELLAPGEAEAAFGLEPAPRPRWIHPAAPYPAAATGRRLLWTGLAFALLNLLLFGWAWTLEGELLLDHLVDPVEYLEGDWVSAPIALDGSVLGLRLGVPAGAERLEARLGLADGRGRVVAEGWQDLGGGDAPDPSSVRRDIDWSRARWKPPPAGSYRLLLRVGGATGRHALRLELRQGLAASGPFLWAGGLALLVCLGAWLHRGWFAAQRGYRGRAAIDSHVAQRFEQVARAGRGRRAEPKDAA